MEKIDSDLYSQDTKYPELDTISRIQFSRYGKVFVEHLFTNRRELFNLLNEAVVLTKQHLDNPTDGKLASTCSEKQTSFYKELETLLTSVGSKGNTLDGACGDCYLKFFSPKDIEVYESEFKKLEQTDLYKLWFGKH